MVNAVHQQLTPSVYTFIFDSSNHDEEDQNQAPNAEKQARKAKKEGKQIGLLVKAIEEWEFNLIKLTRNCKVLYCRKICLWLLFEQKPVDVGGLPLCSLSCCFTASIFALFHCAECTTRRL